MTHFIDKTDPKNNTDYGCHLKALEIVQPITWVHITTLINRQMLVSLCTSVLYL